jgi:hypothetical protein
VISLVLAALGLAFTSLGAYANIALDYTIPVINVPFHLGLATIGLGLIVLAITAALRFIEGVLGVFLYTLLIIALTAGIIYGIFLVGLAPSLLPRIGLSTPSGSYSYNSGCPAGGCSTIGTYGSGNATSTQSGVNPPSGLPAFPKDPLGIGAWFSNNPNLSTLILEGVIIGGVALVLIAVFLRRKGTSLLPEIGSLD